MTQWRSGLSFIVSKTNAPACLSLAVSKNMFYHYENCLAQTYVEHLPKNHTVTPCALNKAITYNGGQLHSGLPLELRECFV